MFEGLESFRGKLINTLKPKAHDDINSLISDDDNKFIMNLVMGSVGGGGANIGKAAKNILTKILSRNKIGLRNIKNMAGKGQGSISPDNRAFFANEISRAKNLGNFAKPANDMSLKALGPFNPGYMTKNKGLQALLPFLLASMAKNYPMLSPLEGETPNIGRPPKQY